jgi:hypothetical protein
MSTEANKALVRRYFEDLANHADLSVAADIITPEHVADVEYLTRMLHTAFPVTHRVILHSNRRACCMTRRRQYCTISGPPPRLDLSFRLVSSDVSAGRSYARQENPTHGYSQPTAPFAGLVQY